MIYVIFLTLLSRDGAVHGEPEREGEIAHRGETSHHEDGGIPSRPLLQVLVYHQIASRDNFERYNIKFIFNLYLSVLQYVISYTSSMYLKGVC